MDDPLVDLVIEDNEAIQSIVKKRSLKGTMDGWEVGKHAREIDPEFPIVTALRPTNGPQTVSQTEFFSPSLSRPRSLSLPFPNLSPTA